MRSIVLLFFAVMSCVSFFAYAIDKRKARRNRWRISKSMLLTLGFLGGSVGAILGMKLFHHKTRHWYFWAVNLLGLIWQVAIVFYLR